MVTTSTRQRLHECLRAASRLLALLLASLLTSITFAAPTMADTATTDPTDTLLWLEDVQGDRALAWVRERNAESEKAIESLPGHSAMREAIAAILDSREQIPYIARHGDAFYNLWRDQKNPRGLWRRTTLAEYRNAEPKWETVIDLDALGRAEGENWVWAGANCLGPDYRRCLVSLSRGGADAHVVREFDLVDKRFVEGGFTLPEAKSSVDWISRDAIYVASDFGAGSMTDSGYPRVIKRWQRGSVLADAKTVFEVERGDVAAAVSVDLTPGYERTTFERAIDFYRSRISLLIVDKAGVDKLVPVDKPDDAQLRFWRDLVLIELRSDWKIGDKLWPRGSLLASDAKRYLAGERKFDALFTPTATRSLASYTATKTTLVLDVLDNVAGRLQEWKRVDGRWQRRDVAAPHPGRLGVSALHDPLIERDELAETLLVDYADFLTPDALMLGRAGSDGLDKVKSRPSFFDGAGMRVEQLFARSKDGTAVPYFVVRPRNARAGERAPTLLYGYGGFEVSQTPFYSGIVGSQWLARGGVFVLANIRGGGEFGPAWHQAAVGQHKQKSYDDFIAVAEDLIARGISSAAQLGIEGGSNGGLLVGAVMVQRPELFKAVVCQVPLLDMKRYHRLLAGASWMAEYGDPDKPEDWAAISRYSPYQNVRKGVKMPSVIFTTSTRDDRVHPGHARKMAERMREQGHRVLYWENIEGGHGGAADNAQRARMTALEYGFLWRELANAGQPLR